MLLQCSVCNVEMYAIYYHSLFEDIREVVDSIGRCADTMCQYFPNQLTHSTLWSHSQACEPAICSKTQSLNQNCQYSAPIFTTNIVRIFHSYCQIGEKYILKEVHRHTYCIFHGLTHLSCPFPLHIPSHHSHTCSISRIKTPLHKRATFSVSIDRSYEGI